MMQKMMRRIVVFNDKYPYIGPLFWVFSVQYFIVQLIVAAAWPKPYSWSQNYISDLGATSCGEYMARFVCSPLNPLMNLSFIVFGISMALGSLLLYQEFRRSNLSLVVFVGLSLSGFGTMLVGLFPENTVFTVHQIGAVFGLFVGNLACLLIAIGFSRLPAWFRIYSGITGIVCIAAFVSFATSTFFGLGAGTIERLASYPFTVWLTIFGIYMTRMRYKYVKGKMTHA